MKINIDNYSRLADVMSNDRHKNFKLPCGCTVAEIYERAHSAIDKFNRAQIFKAACSCIKNEYRNQFAAAANYADRVLDFGDYDTASESFEISSCDCKKGWGCEVVRLFASFGKDIEI